MKLQMTLTRNAAGEVDLRSVRDEVRISLARRDPEDTEVPTVTREIRDAAGKELIEAARRLSFESHRAIIDAIHETIRREPELFWLSRAPVDLHADIRVKP